MASGSASYGCDAVVVDHTQFDGCVYAPIVREERGCSPADLIPSVSVAMSTFALVLQLWFTLSNAMQPPKMKTTQRDCFRNAIVSRPLLRISHTV